MGDVIADPSGSWEPGTAEAYIDQKVGEINVEVASEVIARQTIDSNLQTQINTEVNTRSTNDTEQNNRIGVLEEAYRNLTENDVIVGPRPSSGQLPNVIYREPDQGHTPPQFYSDYMWYNNVWVLMAQYDNGVDNNPLPTSNNLVKSSGVFNSIGGFDVSVYNNGAIYHNLTEALQGIPAEMKVGGISIKFIQEITPSQYSVVKTENVTTQPSGTALSQDPNIVSGTYTASELSSFASLPTTLNSSITYYLEISSENYTTWVITYVHSSDNKYVQYRLMSDTFNTTPANWQGVDDAPIAGSKSLVESSGIEESEYKLAKDNNLDFFRKINVDSTTTVLFDNISIKHGYILNAKVKSLSNFDRLVVNYNGADSQTNRIFDISNGIANKLYSTRMFVYSDISNITAVLSNGSSDIELSYTVELANTPDVFVDLLDINNNTPVINKIIDENGNIVNQDGGRLIKCYINDGKYIIGGNVAIYSMWRYSDDSYDTPIECVYPLPYGQAQNVAQELNLSSGYYAIYTNSSNKKEYNIYLLKNPQEKDLAYRALLDAPFVNTRLTHNYVNTLTLKIGKTIVNGAIVNGTPAYYYCIEHIPAGRYIVYTPEGTASSDALWKFTDSTCTVLSSQIIGKMKAGNKSVVDLVDGYYIFCYYKTSIKNGVLVSADDELAKALYDVPEIDYISYCNVIDSAYINSSGLISTTGVSATYHVAKFGIITPGKYVINVTKTASSVALVKYTDCNYSTVSEILIANSITDLIKDIELDRGFYAVGWNGDIKTSLVKTNRLQSEYIKKIAKYVVPFNSQQLSNLKIVGTATRNNDGSINVSGGISNRVEGLFCVSWYNSQSAKFRCSNGVSMIIGKYDGILRMLGGYFEAYTDNGISYVKQYHLQSDGTTILKDTKQLEFVLVENEDYELRINKYPKKMTLEIIGSYNEYALLEFTAYTMCGNAFMSSNHNAIIKNYSLGINCFYDTCNIKLGIWGHSYIAAAGHLLDDYMLSFSGLLAEELGEKEVVNFGYGGDWIAHLNTRMKDELKLVGTKMQYGMICIGENESASATAATIISGIQGLINNLINADITPILFTLEPESTGYKNPNFPDVNSWIRSSGYHYVDMDKVFWDENGNIRTNLYGDGVHPTIAGHRLIYNRIKMDCPFLF